MKNNLKNICTNHRAIALLLSLYFSFASTYFLEFDKFIYKVILIIILTAIVSPVFSFIIKKANIFTLDIDNKNVRKREWFLYIAISVLFCTFYYIALYPGGKSQDTVDQWSQIVNDCYSNWHPVAHTILFYKIPSMIVKDYSFAVIWQLGIISIVLATFCLEYRKIGFSKKSTIIMLILIFINPYNARMFNIVWKDVAFAFILLLSTLMMMYIVDSGGEWLTKKRNITKFSIIMLLMLFIRHNGIICYVCIIGCMLIGYFKYWKRISVMAITVFTLYSITTNILFGYWGVEKHSASFTEAVGIPLNQISYILNNNGNISESNEEFLNNIGNLEIWYQKYNKKNFNKIKWESNAVNVDYITEHKKEFLYNYLGLVKNNPWLAVKSFYNVTSTVWSIEDASNEIGAIAGNNRYEEKEEPIYKVSDKFNYIFNGYCEWINNTGIGKIIFGYGGSLLLIFISMGIITNKSKLYLRKYLPYIPVLSNTIGIMFLLTGEEHRFVYAQVLCAIPLVFYGLSGIIKKQEGSTDYTILNCLFIKKTENTFLQFFRYLFVGGFAAVINMGALFIFTDVFHIYYIIANILAFTLGLIVNYVLSKAIVFTTENVENKTKEFITYAVIGVLGLGIDTLFMFVFTSLFGIYYLISKVISTAITFIWNFFARKIMYIREENKNGRK